jgi:hypothetical protein
MLQWTTFSVFSWAVQIGDVRKGCLSVLAEVDVPSEAQPDQQEYALDFWHQLLAGNNHAARRDRIVIFIAL